MKSVQLISPSRQQEWGLLALSNFILGGAGTGLFLVNYATILFENPSSKEHIAVPYDFLSLSLVAIGFLCVAVEAGRPSRGYRILSGLGKSWVSREVIAFVVFVMAVFLSHFSRLWVFNILAAVSAFCFMIFQGLIVYSARSVPLWNVAYMPVIFLSSGLASGAGISLLFTLSGRSMTGSILPLLSLSCVTLNMVLWFFYLRWSGADSFQEIKQSVLNRHSFKMVLTMVMGHLLAALLLILLWLWQIRAYQGLGETLKGVFVAVSGLAILIGVSAQKAWIILSAGYTGKVALKF